MTLTPDQVKLERHHYSDRYYPVDVDGTLSFGGYIQRPAAERSAKRSGMGIYDRKEKAVIVQPSLPDRVERLTQTARHHESLADEARNRIRDIQRFAHKHQGREA